MSVSEDHQPAPLISGFRREIRRPECNPGFEVLHCIVHLERDISGAIPYLHAAFDGDAYTDAPRSVMFKAHGRLVAVHGGHIAVNALRDIDEANRVVAWLISEINDVWQRRAEITPRTDAPAPPRVLDTLRQLPRTNCADCGVATCLAFAVQVAEGGRTVEDCPHHVGSP
jgi:ArsR family metal-binding transcriptional regulator